MRRFLLHIARLILKHFADKKYLSDLLAEHERRMEALFDSRIDELYDRMMHNFIPETPIGEHLQHIKNHYLMQYVYKDSCFRLIELLCKLEKYRLKGSFNRMDSYIFDLENFYKRDIYSLWCEILTCLNMKKRGLARYLKENTNLAEVESIDTICNNL